MAFPPKLVEISKYSAELDTLLLDCFLECDEKRETRGLANQWEREVVEKFLKEDQLSRVS